MDDFDRKPGAIDDVEPEAAELDLPGPDDPVAWNYVEADTLVVGPDGEELGRVAAMLGTETEGIFHGVASRRTRTEPPAWSRPTRSRGSRRHGSRSPWTPSS